jgi:hypothetical protein
MKERVGCLHQVCLNCFELQVCLDYCGECYGSREPEFFISDETEMNIAKFVGSAKLSSNAEEKLTLFFTSNMIDLECI